jgi:hypothetical protein
MVRIVVDTLPVGSHVSVLLDFQTRYMIHNRNAAADATIRPSKYDGAKAVAEVYYEFATAEEAVMWKLTKP